MSAKVCRRSGTDFASHGARRLFAAQTSYLQCLAARCLRRSYVRQCPSFNGAAAGLPVVYGDCASICERGRPIRLWCESVKEDARGQWQWAATRRRQPAMLRRNKTYLQAATVVRAAPGARPACGSAPVFRQIRQPYPACAPTLRPSGACCRRGSFPFGSGP